MKLIIHTCTFLLSYDKTCIEELEVPRGLTYRSDNFELGTGDIIFFGLLVGRSVLRGYVCMFSCILAVLVGLVLTAIYTIYRGVTVPALPIAMALGIVVYVLVVVLSTQDMVTTFIEHKLYM